MKKRKKTGKEVLDAFVCVTQFGINMLVPIGLMTALGIWIDKRAGTNFFVIICFFMGALAGGQNVYRMAKKIYDAPDNCNNSDKQKEI